MKDIKKILVPVDFTKTAAVAVAKAGMIADLLKADLLLLHVISLDGAYFPAEHGTAINPLPVQDLAKELTNKMEIMQAEIGKRYDVNVRVLTTTGHIHAEIVRICNEEKADMIVMGTHGASGFKELFAGSNAQRVVALSEVPVLTIQENAADSLFRNILIPVDNSVHSREKVSLAVLIAGLFNATIHILGLPDAVEKEDLDKFNIKLHSIEHIIEAKGLPYQIHIAHGDNLATEALKYAEQHACGLIVINTGHESKISGIFPGLFAQQIVNHSTTPILSFKHMEDHYAISAPGFGIE